MLLILIPIAWLSVVSIVVAICCMAARSDGTGAPHADLHAGPVRNVMVVWETRQLADNANRSRRMRRPLEHRRPLHSRRPASRAQRVGPHAIH